MAYHYEGKECTDVNPNNISNYYTVPGKVIISYMVIRLHVTKYISQTASRKWPVSYMVLYYSGSHVFPVR